MQSVKTKKTEPLFFNKDIFMQSFYQHLNVSTFYEKHSFEQEAEKLSV